MASDPDSRKSGDTRQDSEIDILVVPGIHDSGPGHWQSWLEREHTGCRRITGIDWASPVLADWAGRLRDDISRSQHPLIIVAHGFGCLASVTAVADRPDPVAGLVLVAPVSPRCFDFLGKFHNLLIHSAFRSIDAALPKQPLPCTGRIIASRNDPWLPFDEATTLAANWGFELHDAGTKGHLNEESGLGPWPFLLDLLNSDIQQQSPLLHQRRQPQPLRKGRGSVLAAVRQFTRMQLESAQAPQAGAYQQKE